MTKPMKLKKLFKNFYIANLGKRPGYQTVYQKYEQDEDLGWTKMIDTGASDFLEHYAGPLTVDITGDANQDAAIMNVFASTFIKHFWNTRVGYKRPEDFYANLSGFLYENLPLWGQFYKEAIFKHGGFITNTGAVTVAGQGSTSTTTTNQGKSTGAGSTTTTTSGTNDSKTTNSGSTTNNSTSETTGSTQGTTHTDQSQQSDGLDLKTTSPQDQINYDADAIKSGNYTGAYNFNYADEIDGSHNKTAGTSDEKTNQTTTNSSTSQSKGTNSNNSTTTGTTTGTTKEEKNDQSTTTNNGTSNSDTTNNSQTITKERNASVFELATQFNHFVNGAYINIFNKAKQSGLFLLTYY